MPIGRSAKKSLRTALRNKKSNVSFKNKLKTAIKGFLQKPSEKALVEAQSMLDKAQKRNVWHKNKVSRLKSELSKKVGKEVVAKKKVAKKVTKRKVNKKTLKKTGKKM